MYAVIESGGKQYRLQAGDTIKLETLAVEAGQTITLDKVLMVGEGEDVTFGTPVVAGASVEAEVLSHGRHKKIRVIKHKRRKHYHKEQGHRQNYTEIKVKAINQ